MKKQSSTHPLLKLSSSTSKKEVFLIVDSKHNPISPKSNTEIEVFGLKYLSAHHHLMYHRLLSLGKKDTAKEVLMADDMRKLDHIAKTINYDDGDEKWREKVWKFVLDSNYAKFKCCQKSRQYLLRTVGTTIIYIDERSKLLGVTIENENSSKIHPRDLKGNNIIGECLMIIREYLLKKQEYEEEVKSALKRAYALEIDPELFVKSNK